MTDQTTPETPATASASAPPLLTEDDREALVDGLSDVIASWETDGYGPDAFAKFESIIEPLIRRHRAEAVAEMRAGIEGLLADLKKATDAQFSRGLVAIRLKSLLDREADQ